MRPGYQRMTRQVECDPRRLVYVAPSNLTIAPNIIPDITRAERERYGLKLLMDMPFIAPRYRHVTAWLNSAGQGMERPIVPMARPRPGTAHVTFLVDDISMDLLRAHTRHIRTDEEAERFVKNPDGRKSPNDKAITFIPSAFVP